MGSQSVGHDCATFIFTRLIQVTYVGMLCGLALPSEIKISQVQKHPSFRYKMLAQF